MADSNFDACIAIVRRYEGGFVDHPRDPGGATHMGITARRLAEWRGVGAVSREALRALGWEEARAIYHQGYWQNIRAESLPKGIDLLVLDAAVNNGPRRAVEWLQACLGVKVDGQVGPKTLAAAHAAAAVPLIRAYGARRLRFLQGLGHWPDFGRGWQARLHGVEAAALSMAAKAPPQAASAKGPPVPSGARRAGLLGHALLLLRASPWGRLLIRLTQGGARHG